MFLGHPKKLTPTRTSEYALTLLVQESLEVFQCPGVNRDSLNPLCERQICVPKENVRIWCKTERSKDWVRLLPVISLVMNSQASLATGYSPHELFLGRLTWFLHAPYPEDSYSTVGKWVNEQQDKVDKANAMLQEASERQWNKKNKHRVPASYQEEDWVLVHHRQLPAWPCSTSDDAYSGPSRILSVDGHGITVR